MRENINALSQHLPPIATIYCQPAYCNFSPDRPDLSNSNTRSCITSINTRYLNQSIYSLYSVFISNAAFI